MPTRILIFLFFGLMISVTVSAQKIQAVKKSDFEGYWSGTGTGDLNVHHRDKFDYELQLHITGNKVEGFSITTLTIEGEKFVAKAKIAGEIHDNYLKCRETENYYEERLPMGTGWVPFDKMELILRKRGEKCTLEGLYEVMKGQEFGRLKLDKTPPRV